MHTIVHLRVFMCTFCHTSIENLLKGSASVVFQTPKSLYGMLSNFFMICSISTLLFTLFTIELIKPSVCQHSTDRDFLKDHHITLSRSSKIFVKYLHKDFFQPLCSQFQNNKITSFLSLELQNSKVFKDLGGFF